MLRDHEGVAYLYALADIPVPMVLAVHRIIRDCNEPFARLFGYERREMTGLSFRKLYPDVGDFVRVGEQWRMHLNDGSVYLDERVMCRRDGTRFWCRVRGLTNTPEDPLAEAIYCIEPMERGVAATDHVLSGRQRQILTLIGQGMTSGEAADELGLSRRTVEAHRARLMKSLGLRNGAELMVWFSERGG